MAEEPLVFMTRSDVEATLRKEKEKATASLISLDMKPPYPSEIVAIPYSIKCVALQFRSSTPKEITNESALYTSSILWDHILEIIIY